MDAGGVFRSRAKVPFGLGVPRELLGLAIWLALNLNGCSNFERQNAGPPLEAAQRRLARAEKQRFDIGARASEYLAVAAIAEKQLAAEPQPAQAKTPAVALYSTIGPRLIWR
jgi:hypothetical protein